MESTPGRAGRRSLVGILALAILLSFAFGPFQTGRVAAQLPSAALPQIAITAQEYSFDAPAQITAGLLAVTYDNLGSQIHNLFFLRLKPGSTIDDIRAVRDLQQLMALADSYGGTTTTLPGQRRRLILDLPEGAYVLFSSSTGADRVPDFAKGMLQALAVVSDPGATAPQEPAADLSVSLTDAAVILVPATLPAGPQIWKITSDGTTYHELTVTRLAPDKTLDDLVAFLDAGRMGPPPGEPVAGMETLPPGTRAWLLLDLTPGTYGVNDASGGPTQALIASFTVADVPKTP